MQIADTLSIDILNAHCGDGIHLLAPRPFEGCTSIDSQLPLAWRLVRLSLVRLIVVSAAIGCMSLEELLFFAYMSVQAVEHMTSSALYSHLCIE